MQSVEHLYHHSHPGHSPTVAIIAKATVHLVTEAVQNWVVAIESIQAEYFPLRTLAMAIARQSIVKSKWSAVGPIVEWSAAMQYSTTIGSSAAETLARQFVTARRVGQHSAIGMTTAAVVARRWGFGTGASRLASKAGVAKATVTRVTGLRCFVVGQVIVRVAAYSEAASRLVGMVAVVAAAEATVVVVVVASRQELGTTAVGCSTDRQPGAVVMAAATATTMAEVASS